MTDYHPGETPLGTTCYAPVKQPNGTRKTRHVKVTWLSHDGLVTEVTTTNGRPLTEAFAVSRLRRRKPRG